MASNQIFTYKQLEDHPPSWKRIDLSGKVTAPRSSHTAVYSDDTIYIFGGYGNRLYYQDIISINTTAWKSTQITTVEKNSDAPRMGHSCVMLNPKQIYFYGGWNGDEYLNSGILFDLDSLTMLLEDSGDRIIPDPLRDHTMNLMKNKKNLYLFGGTNCIEEFDELWKCDETWEWSLVNTLGTIHPSARRGHTMTGIEHNFWLFGGLQGSKNYFNDIYIFNTKRLEWTKPIINGEPPPARAWHTATSLGNLLVVIGGSSGHTFYSDIWCLDTVKLVWNKVSVVVDGDNNFYPKASHTATHIGNGKILVFGGITPVGSDLKITPTNDCFILDTGIDVK